MTAWNKGKRVGQKKAFKLEEIWRIRIRLEIENKLEQLALFNLAIDSKLRSCDLLSLKVRDISSASLIQSRAMIEQQKTHKEVQFEITPKTQQCLSQWIYQKTLTSSDFLFPSPRRLGQHICYHYYANIVKNWVSKLGLDITQYGTHSLRRTKASLIYAKTKNLKEGKSNNAKASTLKTRLTWDSGKYNNFFGKLEIDNVSYIGNDSFNNTKNGKVDYPVVADPKGTDINQLFLEYQKSNSSLLIGRQRINHNSQRFIGGVAWRQNEQTFDGARIKYNEIENLTIDYSYVNNVNRIFGPSGEKSDLKGNLTFLNAVYQLTEKQKISAFIYDMDFDSAISLSNTTYGITFDGDYSLIQLQATYASQNETGANPNSFNSSYWALDLGTKLFDINANIGIESLGSDNNMGFFTPLATLHKFQGWGDKFLTTPEAGIEDIYIKLKHKFNTFTLSLAWHDFSAEKNNTDYGSELDISIAYKISENTSLLIKFASYDADDFSTDTDKAWIAVSSKF